MRNDLSRPPNLSLELFGVQCAAQIADWSGEIQVSVIGVDESIRVHPRPVCTADQPVVPLQCRAKCTAAAAPHCSTAACALRELNPPVPEMVRRRETRSPWTPSASSHSMIPKLRSPTRRIYLIVLFFSYILYIYCFFFSIFLQYDDKNDKTSSPFYNNYHLLLTSS